MSVSFSNAPAFAGVARNNFTDFSEFVDFNFDEKKTSRQAGNVKSEIAELYSDGKLQNKTVNTYYVDSFTQQKDPNRPMKTTTYHYNDSGVLKKAEMKKECTNLHNEYKFEKTKIGNNGKWFNSYLKLPDMTTLASTDGTIKYANFEAALDGLQTKIKDLPKHAQNMFYAGLDFLMENIKKIR